MADERVTIDGVDYDVTVEPGGVRVHTRVEEKRSTRTTDEKQGN